MALLPVHVCEMGSFMVRLGTGKLAEEGATYQALATEQFDSTRTVRGRLWHPKVAYHESGTAT